MRHPARPVDTLSRAITLQQKADALALQGHYWTAAILFEQAAHYALTPQGVACLLAKAGEAKSQIDAPPFLRQTD